MNGNNLRTISQKMAEVAFARVNERSRQDGFDKYETFAKKFPSLVHACGLAQAVAFAEAKDETTYLGHLADVIRATGENVPSRNVLAERSRTAQLNDYLRLSRLSLLAAGWLKRYVEAFKKD
jgi:CRISPR-associated protein Cmr5